MDKVSVVKREIQAAEWERKIEDCRTSGLTVVKWCEENGISIKTYYYHLRKIRERLCEQIPVPIGSIQEQKAEIRITVGEVTAEIPNGVSAETIEAVIRAMKC